MSVDSYWSGVILIGFTVTFAMAGVRLARKLLTAKTLIAEHSISGNFLTIVGTMYAVLLGLIVFDALSRFQKTAFNVEYEADKLNDIVYLGDRMPPEKRRRIRALANRYAELVCDREWKAMSRGEHDPESRRTILQLMAQVRDWEPSTESEKAVYATSLVAATELWNARRERLLLSTQGIPALEWVAVIVGGVVTVGVTYVFVLEDIHVQYALTALVSLVVALNIYLIVMFGYPFSGDLRVSSESFRNALTFFELTGE